MTDDDTSAVGRDDAHALSGAYAVDALDDLERARFEEHLRSCADCRAEVDGLLETAALLDQDDLVAPPASVRDAVLAGITSIRPLPPEVPATAPAAAPAPTPVDELARRRERRLPGARLLVAAAAVVLIAVGGTFWLRASDDNAAPPTVAERVLNASDAVRVDKKFPDGSHATVVRSRSVGRAVIITEDMRRAPQGRAYELWLQTPAGEMQAAGLMPDTRDATVLLEGDAARSTGVGITVEPEGGSKQPTTEPIAFFALDA